LSIKLKFQKFFFSSREMKLYLISFAKPCNDIQVNITLTRISLMRSFEDVRCKGNLDPSAVQTSAIKQFRLVNTILWNWIIFWNMRKWIIIISIVIFNVKKLSDPLILQIISSVLVDGLPCYIGRRNSND